MKVGFLDSVYNFADVYETAAASLQEKIANVSVERFTTPHLLKIPLCAKLLFDKGCDAVLVYLTALPDDFDEIHLVQEKIIDLELSEKKFVFFVIVGDTEFKNEEQLKALTQQRIGMVALAIEKVVAAPSQLSANIADPGFSSAMGMFSAQGMEASALGGNEDGGTQDAGSMDLGGSLPENDPDSRGEDGGRSLF